MCIQKEKTLLCQLCMTLVLVVLFPLLLQAHDSALTVNVMYRTFLINWGASTGTAFTIDHEGKQYLVTARHVVKGIQSGDVIKIRHERKWKDLPVNVVGIGKGKDLDVSVLACSTLLSPTFPLVASSVNLIYGTVRSFLRLPLWPRARGRNKSQPWFSGTIREGWHHECYAGRGCDQALLGCTQ